MRYQEKEKEKITLFPIKKEERKKIKIFTIFHKKLLTNAQKFSILYNR